MQRARSLIGVRRMPRGHSMKVVLLLVSLTMACVGSAPSRLEGDYDLVLIGSRSPLEVASDTNQCFTPIAGRFRFTGAKWTSSDSISAPPRCVAQVANELQKEARAILIDSGHFVRRGDTLDLFVADTMIGERGLVNRGFVRGDTLVFLGSDVEPGDWIYVRKH